jgi:pyruvate formate lyase activating enzyme
LTDAGSTPSETIEKAAARAKEKGLEYVYAGNISGSKWESTYCPDCGAKVIERTGYVLGRVHLDGNRCRDCGREIKVLGEAKGGRRSMIS